MKKVNTFGLKNIKGRRYFVYYGSDGRIKSRRKQKGTKLRLRDAISIYKNNGTFFKNRYITKLTSVKEKSYLRNDSKTYRYNKKVPSQYVIIGTYDNSVISARSDKKIWSSRTAARDQARTRFLNLLHERVTGKYDVDVDKQKKEVHLDNVTNIKEGWVYYEKI